MELCVAITVQSLAAQSLDMHLIIASVLHVNKVTNILIPRRQYLIFN